MSGAQYFSMSLSEELIYEVLLRLPWHSLLRFRCVSKGFLGLIHSPDFIKKHDNQSHDSVLDCTVITTDVDRMYSVDFNFPHNLNYAEEKELHPPLEFHPSFTGCCNGVVCLVRKKPESYMLWNPFNDTFQKIECCDQHKPLDDYFTFGFGYDHSTDDYKIVRLEPAKTCVQCLDVYSMRKDSWHRVQMEFDRGFVSGFDAICVEDAIHWLWLRYSAPFGMCIATFDLRTEALRSLSLPPVAKGEEGIFKLYDLRGRLCVPVCKIFTDTGSILWVMEEYGVESCWIPLFKITSSIEPIGYFPKWNNRLLCVKSRHSTGESPFFSWWFKPQDKSSTPEVQMVPNKVRYDVRKGRATKRATIILPFKSQVRLRNSTCNHHIVEMDKLFHY